MGLDLFTTAPPPRSSFLSPSPVCFADDANPVTNNPMLGHTQVHMMMDRENGSCVPDSAFSWTYGLPMVQTPAGPDAQSASHARLVGDFSELSKLLSSLHSARDQLPQLLDGQIAADGGLSTLDYVFPCTQQLCDIVARLPESRARDDPQASCLMLAFVVVEAVVDLYEHVWLHSRNAGIRLPTGQLNIYDAMNTSLFHTANAMHSFQASTMEWHLEQLCAVFNQPYPLTTSEERTRMRMERLRREFQLFMLEQQFMPGGEDVPNGHP